MAFCCWLPALLLPLLALHARPAHAQACGSWMSSNQGWHCHKLAANYQLYYKSNGTTMYFGLDVWPSNNTGLTQLDWIGIGISEAGGMPGADIAVLNRDDSAPSGWVLWDMFAREFARPSMDAMQDKTLISVQEKSDGRIRARFSFPMQSCDQAWDRRIRTGLPSFLVYAFGQGAFDYHGTQNRGNAQLTLVPAAATTAASTTLDNSTLPASPPTTPGSPHKPKANVHMLSLFMPAIAIPTTDTDPYMCVDFELPGTPERPFHMTEFRTVVNTTTGPNPSQDRYVHHLVLYNCTARPNTYGKSPYDCTGFPDTCQTFILVSTEPGLFKLPDAAGFRLGVGAMRYVTLQIHYNNVALDEGVVDSSGFRITYTSRLRPHDMGVLSTGMTSFQIPPRSRWSTGPTVCPPGCTRRFKQNVTLVASLLHMHQIGVGMSVQHFRPITTNNITRWTELEPLAVRQYFDFKFQPDMNIPPTTATMMPGDALITTCNYTNTNSYPVNFGTRSTDEMCYHFLMYYPVSNTFTDCTELPLTRQVGMALCEGTAQDEELLNDLFAVLGGTYQQQYAAFLALVQAGTLASRNDTLAALMAGVPYVNQLPASCPATRTQG